MSNEGKIFEKQWKLSANTDGLCIIRLNDTSLSFVREKEASFTCENPCDFIVFYRGHLFPLELKSTQYSSMSIQKDPDEKAMIKLHQISSLANLGEYEDVCPGFILNFRKKDSLEEQTYWVPIADFSEFFESSGKKSINKFDVLNMKHSILVEQKIKRTKYTYFVRELLDKLIDNKTKLNGDEW